MKSWLAGLAAAAAASQPALAADSALIDAVRADQPAVVEQLLHGKADVNAPAPDGATALHWAVYNDDLEMAKRLIKAGADATARNHYGATPMSLAAVTGNPAMIRLLLKAGADADSPNGEGQTALMIVARTNRVEAARLLLEHDADINAREGWRGQTAVMWAAAESQPEMVAFLAGHGADLDARSKVNHWKRPATAESRQQFRPVGGFTALLYAARQGCTECARGLVKAGANIDLASPEGISPLLMAALNAHFDTAAYLVSAGANVDKWDKWGRSPLYAAVDYNTIPVGGRPDRPVLDKTSALDLMDILLKAGANPDLQLKLLPPFRDLREDRAGDRMLTIGTTPLIRAAKGGDVAAVKLLLAHGASATLPNSIGVTPLMAAASIGSTRLDTRGVNRNEPDGLATVKLLVEAGAEVDAKDAKGQTALFGAAEWGWNSVVRYLVDKGADLKVVDHEGFNLVDAALGKAGGPVRFGIAPEVHEDTASLIKDLMSDKTAANE